MRLLSIDDAIDPIYICMPWEKVGRSNISFCLFCLVLAVCLRGTMVYGIYIYGPPASLRTEREKEDTAVVSVLVVL